MTHLHSCLTVVMMLIAPALAFADDFERAPINYSQATPNNAITRLQAKLDAGKFTLAMHKDLGYLPSVLQALDVPVSSQVLVFSKTSLQRNRISPKSPRALYFSDDMYIGHCQDGDVQVIAGGVGQSPVIGQGRDAGDANCDVDDPVPPWAAERVRDDHPDFDPELALQPVPDPCRGPIRAARASFDTPSSLRQCEVLWLLFLMKCASSRMTPDHGTACRRSAFLARIS